MHFRLVPKSMTLDYLERLKRTHAQRNRFTEPTRKKKLNDERQDTIRGKMYVNDS